MLKPNPPSKMMVLEGEALEGCLGCLGRASMSDITALRKPQSFPGTQ